VDRTLGRQSLLGVTLTGHLLVLLDVSIVMTALPQGG
jgi:hypothetical protein